MLETIKELRARTHLGLTECKKALEDNDGDLEKAIEYLQKKGTVRRVDDAIEAKEGAVRAVVKDDASGMGLIVIVTCQTDFAARSEIFQQFLNEVVSFDNVAATTSGELAFSIPQDKLDWCTKQLREAVSIKEARILKVPSNMVFLGKAYISRAYTHHSGKIAALVLAEVTYGHQSEAEILSFLDNCCLQIVANKPLSLTRDTIQEQEAKQREIFAAQVPAKAEKMKEKIIQGKVDKWYQEVVLEDQVSILDSEKTVAQLKSDLEAKHGVIKLIDFVRFELGAE